MNAGSVAAHAASQPVQSEGMVNVSRTIACVRRRPAVTGTRALSVVTRADVVDVDSAPRTADSVPPSPHHARPSRAARRTHHAVRALTIVIPDLRFSPL